MTEPTNTLLPILNGDHAQYEMDNVNTPKEERSDWPYPSFDAADWAKAFCKRHPSIDEGTMIGWFANALMRGYDHPRTTPASQALSEDELFFIITNASNEYAGGNYQPDEYHRAIARALLPHLLQREAWRPISEAPRDGRTVLIFDNYKPSKIEGRLQDGDDGYGITTARWDETLQDWIMHQRRGNLILLMNPTHWQPLPQPPRKD